MGVGTKGRVGGGSSVDLTFVVFVAPLVLGIGYVTGLITSAFGAVSLLATILAAVVLLFAILEAFGYAVSLLVILGALVAHVTWQP